MIYFRVVSLNGIYSCAGMEQAENSEIRNLNISTRESPATRCLTLRNGNIQEIWKAKKKKNSRLTNALHFERRFENESAQVSKVQIKTTV